MNIAELKKTRFLSKPDLKTPVLATIASYSQEPVNDENGSELEWVLRFEEETIKPFILKSTNAQLIAGFLGSDEMDDWAGKKIVLYVDPTVTMKGKVTGGIRVRAPKAGAVTPAAPRPTPQPQAQPQRVAPPPPPQAEEEPGEDVPF